MLTREKFDEIFKEYYHILRLYARRYVRDPDIAEDIVEEVFYNLWKNRDGFTPEGTMKSYLFSSIYHKSVNYIKHEKHKARFREYVSTRYEDFLNFYVSEIPNYQESLLSQDLSASIKSAIESLPEQCHRIFILSRKFGFKNREISDFLNISIKAVERQISKALLILREQLNIK